MRRRLPGRLLIELQDRLPQLLMFTVDELIHHLRLLQVLLAVANCLFKEVVYSAA